MIVAPVTAQPPPAGTIRLCAVPVNVIVSCGQTTSGGPAAEPANGTSRQAASAAIDGAGG